MSSSRAALPSSSVYSTARRPLWKTQNVEAQLRRSGVRSLFIVADPAIASTPTGREWLDRLSNGRSVRRFEAFTPNPKIEEIDEGLRDYRAFRPDMIVGLGGGSCLDVAKLIRACDNPHADARAVVQGHAAVATRGPWLLAIPTTSGTGSEATCFSAIYIDGVKHSLNHPIVRPDHAVLDWRLTTSMPTSVTLQTGLDALCQAIESLWSVRSTPSSRANARRALRLIWHALPACVSVPTDHARRQMQLGAHLAGRAIDTSQTTACHALSYVLTSRFGLAHGCAVALMLLPIWRFNAATPEPDLVDQRGLVHLKQAMQSICDVIGAADCDDAAVRLRTFLKRIGAATTLPEAGIDDQGAIELVLSQIDPARVANNPRRLDARVARHVLAEIA
jgi:alcohol dehydrogenase